ncbi:MAG: hypothetical protein WC445_04975 [Patescibacteria group bacterium]
MAEKKMKTITINGQKVYIKKSQNNLGEREGIGYDEEGFPVKFWEGYDVETCGLDEEFLFKKGGCWQVWRVIDMQWTKCNKTKKS